jgi:hypothetical protein
MHLLRGESLMIVTTHPVDTAIPELRQGYDEVVAFADFCYFLTDGESRTEVLTLVEDARALLERVRQRLVTEE